VFTLYLSSDSLRVTARTPEARLLTGCLDASRKTYDGETQDSAPDHRRPLVDNFRSDDKPDLRSVYATGLSGPPSTVADAPFVAAYVLTKAGVKRLR